MTRVLRGFGAVLAISVLAACSSSSGVPKAQETNVGFNGCDKVKCAGDINGAAYEIKLPKSWNGTLLLWSHGYRQAQPAPPDYQPVNTSAESAPSLGSGGQDVASKLLDEGYALAGSAYKTNGWAVADGVQADEDLYSFFSKNVGKPQRVYAWGASLGGLVTQTLSEKHPDWVSAAAPMCGVVAGANLNLDVALDVAYAVKTFFYPQLKLSGYSSWQDGINNWNGAVQAILAATKDLNTGVPAIILTASLVDAPSKTANYDGSNTTSKVSAYVESIVTALGYGTFDRYEFEQRVGGNPSDNSAVDYATRISAAERESIEAISKGATDRLLSALASGQRVHADSAARAAADKLGNPRGTVKHPTFAVHTENDPLVLVQNESVLTARTAKSGDPSLLVHAYTAPPASYQPPSSGGTGAPYGAGHCNFTAQTFVGTIQVLDDWARNGVYPTAAAVTAAFGNPSGYDPTYQPAMWPAQSNS